MSSGTKKLLQAAAGASSSGEIGYDYWISGYGTSTTAETSKGIAAFANGSIVSLFDSTKTFPEFSAGLDKTAVIVKYNEDGTTDWYKRFDSLASSGDYTSYDIVIDSNKDIIACGEIESAFVDAWLAKFDADGNTIWARKGGAGDGRANRYVGIAVDATDNIFVSGTVTESAFSTPQHAFVQKYNSSGTLQWTYGFNTQSKSSNTFAYNGSIMVDPSDGHVVVAFTTGSYGTAVAKINSSTGGLIWDIYGFPNSGSNHQFSRIAWNPVTNHIVLGGISDFNSGSFQGVIVALNSSGTLIASQSLTTILGSSTSFIEQIAVDASTGKTYLIGYENIDSSFESYNTGPNVLIAEFNTSYQLESTTSIFGENSSYNDAGKAAVVSGNNIIIGFRSNDANVDTLGASNNNNNFVIKLPLSGVANNTFGTFEYIRAGTNVRWNYGGFSPNFTALNSSTRTVSIGPSVDTLEEVDNIGLDNILIEVTQT